MFKLKRYNGKSHEHTNIIERDRLYGFYIHKATERYQAEFDREEGGIAHSPIYVQGFDWGQPGFAQTSSTYSLGSLLLSGGKAS